MPSHRQVMISADCHCGADLHAYKPYLDHRLHDEFDAWARSFADGWADLDSAEPERRVGVASYAADVNWDSAKRLAALEDEGIVAEVLFPNTAPPFFPSGAVSAPAPGVPPASRVEYELRFAGVQAHNRWLVDFCDDVPGRRAGIAQIFLSDLDDAVAEVEFAARSGLKGVLLPGDHHTQLQNLFDRDFDRLWAACADLGLPVGRHGVFVSEPNSEQNSMAGAAIGLLESKFFTQRALGAMILSGVFERHPRLKFVLTEVGVSWVPDYLRQLDAFVREARHSGTIANMFGGEAAARLSKLPSEYFASNCYVGSFLDASDMEAIEELGPEHVMWGADYPHHEGTSPWTVAAVRLNMATSSPATMSRLLVESAVECYGFDVDLLATAAAECGPWVDELRRPLGADERPSYPDDTVCATFRPGPAS